jgi:hypothetical protein
VYDIFVDAFRFKHGIFEDAFRLIGVYTQKKLPLMVHNSTKELKQYFVTIFSKVRRRGWVVQLQTQYFSRYGAAGGHYGFKSSGIVAILEELKTDVS